MPLLAWLSLSGLFALTGPFGTFERFGLLGRFGLWLAVVGLSLLIALTLRLAITLLRPATEDLAASAAAVFTTAGLLAVTLPPLGLRVVGLAPERVPGPAEVAIVVAMLGIGLAILNSFVGDAPPARPAADPTQPRLLARLPDEVAGELQHLSVDDHYVEVVTDRGKGRVLMRFSDALEEVVPVDGLRVHRSHWVARAAVADVNRARGRTFLTLKNGTRVPVSRAYEGEVESLRVSG